MEQHDETGVGKSLSEGLNALFLHAGVPVGHGDRRPWPVAVLRYE
jgi:hypothetical protein